VLARTHQNLVWARQRQSNVLRSTLREFYPAALQVFGDDLDHPEALAVLERAPAPGKGRHLTRPQIASALRKGGRKRGVEVRVEQIRAGLRGEHLAAPPAVERAFGATVASSVGLLAELNRQVAALEAEFQTAFETHPDAKILRGLAGLGLVLGAPGAGGVRGRPDPRRRC
jgi:hypothetical protein